MPNYIALDPKLGLSVVDKRTAALGITGAETAALLEESDSNRGRRRMVGGAFVASCHSLSSSAGHRPIAARVHRGAGPRAESHVGVLSPQIIRSCRKPSDPIHYGQRNAVPSR
jgi:hypothetical protein